MTKRKHWSEMSTIHRRRIVSKELEATLKRRAFYFNREIENCFHTEIPQPTTRTGNCNKKFKFFNGSLFLI